MGVEAASGEIGYRRRMRVIRGVVGLLFLGAVAVVPAGCHVEPPAVPRSGPKSALPPQALLPREHDFVVRFDLARLRGLVGDEATAAIAKAYLPRDHAAMGPILGSKAKVAWAGVTFAEGSTPAVIVAQGEGGALDPSTWLEPKKRAFVGRENGEAGVRWFDRGADAGATDPARLLWLDGGVLASMSTSQVAAVERELAATSDKGRLEPKADALISFVARERALAVGLGIEDKGIREATSYATSMQGLIDVVGQELLVELVFGFKRSDVAAEVEQAGNTAFAELRASPKPKVAAIAGHATVARFAGTKVRFRIVLPSDQLKLLLL